MFHSKSILKVLTNGAEIKLKFYRLQTIAIHLFKIQLAWTNWPLRYFCFNSHLFLNQFIQISLWSAVMHFAYDKSTIIFDNFEAFKRKNWISRRMMNVFRALLHFDICVIWMQSDEIVKFHKWINIIRLAKFTAHLNIRNRWLPRADFYTIDLLNKKWTNNVMWIVNVRNYCEKWFRCLVMLWRQSCIL